jgi:acyl carrier protein
LFYATGDLVEEASTRAAVDDLRAQMGGIDGVIDLARIIDNASILTKRTDRFDAVMAVKAAGTRVLDRALADDPLDFFITFSSLATWFGLAGGADYAAACGYQEGLIAERAARHAQGERSGQSLSIAWPQWRYDTELSDARGDALAKAGLVAIDIGAGIDIIQTALRSGERTLAVVVGDPVALDRLIEVGTAGVDLDTLSDRELVDYVARLRQAANQDDPIARPVSPAGRDPGDIAVEIRAAFAKILALDPARISDAIGFADLGLDSIKALHVAERLASRIDVAVEPVLFFDFPNVPELAAELNARVRTELREAGE